jgi:hypothetical protein
MPNDNAALCEFSGQLPDTLASPPPADRKRYHLEFQKGPAHAVDIHQGKPQPHRRREKQH